MKYFVTSDVHSFFNEMQNALHKAGFEESNPDHKLVICGDIFDRGEQSKEMYKYLRDIDNQLILVRGNHEDLLETCYNEIMSGSTPKSHHWSNKTVKTICDLCSIDERDLFRISEETRSRVHSIMLDVLLWIKDKAVDYFTAGDYIFVHGWVPCICDDYNIHNSSKKMSLAPLDWWEDENYIRRKGLWDEARWLSGVDAWTQGCTIEGKTIVCGHWHTSAAHYKIHGVGSEWGEDACFDIFQDKGIVMLDACTAYTGKVNVMVITHEEVVNGN